MPRWRSAGLRQDMRMCISAGCNLYMYMYFFRKIAKNYGSGLFFRWCTSKTSRENQKCLSGCVRGQVKLLEKKSISAVETRSPSRRRCSDSKRISAVVKAPKSAGAEVPGSEVPGSRSARTGTILGQPVVTTVTKDPPTVPRSDFVSWDLATSVCLLAGIAVEHVLVPAYWQASLNRNMPLTPQKTLFRGDWQKSSPREFRWLTVEVYRWWSQSESSRVDNLSCRWTTVPTKRIQSGLKHFIDFGKPSQGLIAVTFKENYFCWVRWTSALSH